MDYLTMENTQAKNKIKITVIIPIYNNDESLDRCLESVLNQTLEEIEVICVDDGSTDNSSKILEDFSSRDSRVVISSQHHQGNAVARNIALTMAKGQYVSFVNPEDYYFDINALNLLYEAAEKHNSLIAGGCLVQLLPNGKLKTTFPEEIDGYYFHNECVIDYRDYQFNYGFQRFIFNRHMICDKKLNFPLLNQHDDIIFFQKAMIAAGRFSAIPKQIYVATIHTEQVDWDANNYQPIVDLIRSTNEELKIAIENDLEIVKSRLISHIFGEKNYWDIIVNHSNIDIVKIEAQKMIDLCKHIDNNLIIEKTFETPFDSKEHTLNIATTNEEQSQTKVSIVVPVYNVEEYLPDCLNSLINQTLKEIEIICINDCSPDNSIDIINKYIELDNRIKCINLEINGGLSNARNVALEQISGEYVIFIDSDDMLKHDALEHLYSIASTNDIDQIHFLFSPLYEGNYKSFEKYYAKEFPQVFGERYFSGTYLLKRLMETKTFFPSACIKFTKTDFLKKHNITFTKGYIHEDNQFSAKTTALSERVLAINKRYYVRRLHDNSIMTSNDPEANIRHLCGYAATIGILQSEIKAGIYTLEQQKLINSFTFRIAEAIARYGTKISNKKLTSIGNLLKSCPGDENWDYFIPILISYEKKYTSAKIKLEEANIQINKDKKTIKNLQLKTNSLSYKIGLIITWIPRKILDTLLCIKIHGFLYTCKHIVKILLRIK